MDANYFKQIQFELSAARLKQLPAGNQREVAFVGRSNAGKSTALNAIANIKRLARVSKTPGRTQLINFFRLNSDDYLVDLPGYGYAATPEAIRRAWQALVTGYIDTRQSLAGIILIMDCRHPWKLLDKQLVSWVMPKRLPIHVLLTKADKLSTAQAKQSLKQAEATAFELDFPVSLQLFSGTKKAGIDQVQLQIYDWLTPEYGDPKPSLANR